MKKKKLIGLVILLLVLVAALVIYKAVKKGAEDKVAEEEENETVITKLIDITEPEYSRISYEYEGERYSFLNKDGTWVMEGEEEFPLNTTRVDIMKNELNEASVSSVIKDVTELEQYGLAAPVLSIEATAVSGEGQTEEISLYVGDASKVGSGRYVYLKSDPSTVYVTEENIFLRFDFNREELFEEKKLPEFAAEDITGVLFMVDGYEKYDLVRSTDTESDAAPEGENTSEAGAEAVAETTGSWKLLKNSTGEVTLCDADEIKDILTAAASIKFDHMADYREEHLADYGIDPMGDSQLLVWYRSSDAESSSEEKTDVQESDTKEIGLIFGDRTEDGDFYVNVDGTPNVFVISAASLENFVIAD